MKERRAAGRVGDLAIYSDEERRRELRRRARLESESLDNESPQTEERERVRRLLYAEGDWLDALKHGSQTPCKVTRVERETAIADRAVATSPQAALAYAQWILAKDRGGPLISGDAPNPWAIGDEVSHARSRQTDEPLGSLASMFAHQGASSRDELAARRRAAPVHAAPATRMSQVATPERPQARLAARELPGHHAGLSAEQSEAQLDEVLALLRGAGSGEPLPEAVAARMEAELGRSFAHVRIHLDSVAAEACAQLGAQAFTLGDHIYFGAGQFVPDSDAGAGLLRHELTHVVQHARGELASHGRAELVSSTSAIEAEARAAEAPKARPIRAMPAWAGGARKREGLGPDARATEIADARVASAAAMQQGAGPIAAEPPSAGQLALAPASPAATQGPAGALPTVVNLTGTFAPPAKVAAHIAKAGDAGAGVKVALPGLTKPAIITVKRVDGRYVTVEDKPQLVPLSHPLFVLAGPLAPMLRIQIGESGDNAVTGYVTTGAGDLAAMQNALQGNMAMLGLRGFAVPQLALTNRLAGGKLSFGTSGDVAFTLGGWVHGTVSLAMEDKKVSFAARAAIHARGIKDAQIVFTRDAKGKITGDAALSAELGPHFKGNINATYANGALAVRGKLGYQSEKLKGQLNVLFADEAEAEAMARGELPADALKPADSGEATPKGGGKRGLAGSGTLDFTFSDWLTGSAKTVFGPTGNVTVVGKIAPPKSVQLMAPKSRKLTLLPKVRLEACYGIPRLLDVHVGIAVGLDAYGVLGPVVMTDLELDGIYSTDPKVRNRFSLTGTVRAQAEAGLQLSLDGYAGLSALLHSINFGASVWGRAALQAYAEARATLGYRELADPAAGKKGEHYLQGHLEMAARPVLSFGGGLFIEATGPFVNKRWDWPLGSLQYPLPGQLGIGADIDYVIGSGKVPDVKFSRPEFDASKFTEQLMDGKLPKGGGGNRRADGKFESKTPTKTTQGKQTLQKKQTEKAAITAGDSKTKRTTGNQTEEDKKKRPKTPQEQAKTATSKNKTKDAAAKEGGKRKDGSKEEGRKTVGARIKFRVGSATHTQYIDKGVPMVASTPTAVKSKIAEWQPRLRELEKDQKRKAGGLIGKAIAIEKKVAALAAAAKTDKSKDTALEAKQQELANTLAQLGELMAPSKTEGAEEWLSEPVVATGSMEGTPHKLEVTAKGVTLHSVPAPLETKVGTAKKNIKDAVAAMPSSGTQAEADEILAQINKDYQAIKDKIAQIPSGKTDALPAGYKSSKTAWAKPNLTNLAKDLMRLSESIMLAINKYGAKFKVHDLDEPITDRYPTPDVGVHTVTPSAKNAKIVAPDNLPRESHHVPYKSLYQSLLGELEKTGKKLATKKTEFGFKKKSGYKAMGEAMLDAHSVLQGKHGSDGKGLSAILIHKMTHQNINGKKGAGAHSPAIAELIDQSMKQEEDALNIKYERILRADGRVAVRPTKRHWAKHVSNCRRRAASAQTEAEKKQAAKDLATVKAAQDEIKVVSKEEKDALERMAEAKIRPMLREAFRSGLAQNFHATKVALELSKVDGPDADKAAALDALRSYAMQVWTPLIEIKLAIPDSELDFEDIG